tara:strand:+ start:105932 stop:106507 length:576 start_codon:yes stop_codon:yes gene_type:complete
MIDLFLLPMMALGRLQGSGEVAWLPDWLRRVFKYFATGVITTFVFTFCKLDYSAWQWWQWPLLFLSGCLASWWGEGRGLGWIAGWWAEGTRRPDSGIDGWMKYIPTHKLRKQWQQLVATSLVRGWFWGMAMAIPACLIDPQFWFFWFAYPLAILFAYAWGWALHYMFGDLDAWGWSEYWRHPFAFKILLIL